MVVVVDVGDACELHGAGFSVGKWWAHAGDGEGAVKLGGVVGAGWDFPCFAGAVDAAGGGVGHGAFDDGDGFGAVVVVPGDADGDWVVDGVDFVEGAIRAGGDEAEAEAGEGLGDVDGVEGDEEFAGAVDLAEVEGEVGFGGDGFKLAEECGAGVLKDVFESGLNVFGSGVDPLFYDGEDGGDGSEDDGKVGEEGGDVLHGSQTGIAAGGLAQV